MTAPVSPVDALLDLYVRLGADSYGEEVTQLDHALQCAALARADGARDTLVAAALLHDVGHLLAGPRPAGWRDELDDDRHEAVGARALGRLFGTEVAAPVALHVCAKRWRCAVDPAYGAALSPASQASLAAQGGPLGGEACARLEAHRAFEEAVALRGWDDLAKNPSARPAPLDEYAALLHALAQRAAARRALHAPAG